MVTPERAMAAPHSVVRRVALQLGLGVALLLGAISVVVYLGVQKLHEEAQSRLLAIKVQKLVETSSALLRPGSQDFLRLLETNAVKRQGSRLQLHHADGMPFYVDPNDEAHTLSAQVRTRWFELRSADAQTVLSGRFDIDIAEDERRQQALARLLALATAAGALLSAGLAFFVCGMACTPCANWRSRPSRCPQDGSSRTCNCRSAVRNWRRWWTASTS